MRLTRGSPRKSGQIAGLPLSRMSQVRQQVDFASVSTAKLSRLPRRHLCRGNLQGRPEITKPHSVAVFYAFVPVQKRINQC